MHKFSERLRKLPPYLFMEVDKMKQNAIDDGVDIINFGVGDPDIPTPEVIRESMKQAVDNPENHQYPLGKGKKSFRNTVSKFMKKRYDLEIDPVTQIQPLIGTKEGIAHFPLAFVNPGDVTLVTEPSYPVYNSGTIFSGGEPHFVSLTRENNFLPDWNSVPEKILKLARIMYINYPNNPTGAVADKEFFKKTVALAKEYNIIILHDAAYNEMYYKQPVPSILEVEGSGEVAIEFHSLSKTFSMTGWRIGWACGNSHLVEGLAAIKGNIDSGVFGAIQDAGITALKNYDELIHKTRDIYEKRAKILARGLKQNGWQVNEPEATFYLWTKPPVKMESGAAVKKLIQDAGIVCTPGSGFGESGKGYVRFALTRNKERIDQALDRISNMNW